MYFDEALKNRRSVRNFKKKKISESNIMDILEAGRHAPSAGNLQNWKFVVVSKDLSILSEFISDGDWVDNASHVILVVNEKEQVLREYRENGEKFSLLSCGACIQNMLLKATDLKIGSCWVSSFDSKLKASLNIDPKTDVVGLIILGYSNEFPEMERRDLRDMVEFKR